MLVTPKADTRRSPSTPEAERRTGGEPVRTLSAGHEKITSETARPGRRAVRTSVTQVSTASSPSHAFTCPDSRAGPDTA
jgi:hypothetical protein